MRQDVWHRLDLVARNLLPCFATLLLILVSMVPLRMPHLAPVAPAVALISVYYWSLYRPDLMPLWAIFLVGLFHDLLMAGPMGVGILALMLVYALVESLRRAMGGAGILVLWGVFTVVAMVVFLVGWVLTSLLEGRLLDAESTAFRYLATVAAYPCLAWLFGQLQRALVPAGVGRS